MKFKSLKKRLSLVLAASMILTTVSPALAANEVEKNNNVIEEAIQNIAPESQAVSDTGLKIEKEIVGESNLESTPPAISSEKIQLNEVEAPLKAEKAVDLQAAPVKTASVFFNITAKKVLAGTQIKLEAPRGDSEAKVYYTLNQPLVHPDNTTEYKGEAFEITGPTTISAIAIADGKEPSDIKSYTYDLANSFGTIESPLEVSDLADKIGSKELTPGDFIAVKGKVSRIVVREETSGKKKIKVTYTAIGVEGDKEIFFQEKAASSDGIKKDLQEMTIGKEYVLVGSYYDANGEMQFGFKSISQVKEIIGGKPTPDPELIFIHDIQGANPVSSYEGKEVTIEGIVTASFKDNYGSYMYIQEEDADADKDKRTSEGIFVNGAPLIPVGKKVKVVGTVVEQSEKIESKTGTLYKEALKTTRLEFKSKVAESDGLEPLPTAVKINESNPIPERIFTKLDGKEVEDSTRLLDPEHNAIDFYESLEGMRVEIEMPKVVGFAEKYGNIFVIPSKGKGYEGKMTPAGGIKAIPDYHYGNIITLDFGMNPIIDSSKVFKSGYNFNTGDQFEGNITGFVKYQFGDYKIVCDTTSPLPTKTTSGMKRAETRLVSTDDQLTIASYNIENFTGNAPQKKVDDVADSIVHNLKLPDIIGLVEVQDNDGEGGSSPAANQSYERLIAAIKEKSGIAYTYTQIDPVHGADGGAPKSNIRVGFLYNPTRVMKSDAPQGAGDSMTEAQMVQEKGKWVLAKNPARLGTQSPAFGDTRKSLVACFNFRGEDVYVIGNHFSSKRNEAGPFGNVQPPNVDPATRIAQAQLVNDFVEKEILAHNPAAKVIVLGDMNDFEYSSPVKALEGKQLYNLHNQLPENERYTYIHSGLSQTLDHILVTKAMAQDTEFEPVHMNAEFTFADGRASDHDALMARIKNIGSGSVDLIEPPAVDQNPGQVAKGTKVNLTAKADTVIYYTLDGTVPTTKSQSNGKNTVSIEINQDMTLKAIAVKGDKVSAVMSWTYSMPLSKISIEKAKALVKEGAEVIVEGIVQNKPGAFGGKGYYIDDTTASIYIYPTSAEGVAVGTSVTIKGRVEDFNGLIQIKPTEVTLGTSNHKVEAKVITAKEFKDYRDRLVSLKSAEIISVVSDKYNNTELKLKQGESQWTAKVDSRSGDSYVEGKYKVGMKVDLIGIVKNDKAILCRGFEDIKVIGSQPAPKITLESIQTKDLSGKAVQAIAENSFINILITAKNSDKTQAVTGTLIFKIEKDNKPYRMGLIGTALANNGEYSLGFDTTGMAKGRYDVKVYYWDSLTGQVTLAEMVDTAFNIQ